MSKKTILIETLLRKECISCEEALILNNADKNESSVNYIPYLIERENFNKAMSITQEAINNSIIFRNPILENEL